MEPTAYRYYMASTELRSQLADTEGNVPPTTMLPKPPAQMGGPVPPIPGQEGSVDSKATSHRELLLSRLSSSTSLWNLLLPNSCSHSRFILQSRERKERKRRNHAAEKQPASPTIDDLRCSAIDIETDEWEERMLVEEVAEDVFLGIIARYKEEAADIAKDSVWDGKSLHVTESQVRNLILFFIRQMHARLRQDFTKIFPQGIEGTALSMSDVACCVASLLIVDMAITDDDIHSFAFTVLPGKRVSLANCPIAKRYLYFTFMAFKSTSMVFKPTIDDFRSVVSNVFLNPEAEVPPHYALSIHALKNSVGVIANNSTFKSEMRTFYLTALGIEEELRGDLLTQDTDMTINIGFQKCDEVGRGANGVVYSCVNTANGKFMALKQLKLKSGTDERAIRGEINMLKQLRHNNVIRYYGCAFERKLGVVSILMEFARKSLRSIIDECGGLNAQLTIHYARKTLEGLCYLHDQHIIHRDIKAANILVTEQGEVKVSDFGTAMLSTNSVDEKGGAATATGAKNIQGTPLFLAPEVIHGCVPTESSDIWAFGCTMIEMVSGLNPWWEILQDEPEIPLELLCYRIATNSDGPQIPAQVLIDPWLESVIKSCLNLDPCARPSARQLLATLSMDSSLNTDPQSNSSLTAKDVSTSTVPGADSGVVAGEVHSMWAEDFEVPSSVGSPILAMRSSNTARNSKQGVDTIMTDSLLTDASMGADSFVMEKIEVRPVPYDDTLVNTGSMSL